MNVNSSTCGRFNQALARAVLCRALKLGLQSPNTHALTWLTSSAEDLKIAARALTGDVKAPLVQAVRRWIPTIPLRDESAREAYDELFGHCLRGRVCPYESEYGRAAMLQQAQQLADLSGFYGAFGLRTGNGLRERPDHVACEIEFLEILSLKEASALDRADAEMAEVTSAAVDRFLVEHLGRFGRAFCHAVRLAEPEGFYRALCDLFDVLLEVECGRRGLTLGPELLEVRPWQTDDVPMACGSGEELPPLDLVKIGGGRSKGLASEIS